MSNPASPSSSPPRGDSKGNEDALWEEAFAKMDERTPLFDKLPNTAASATKVFAKCDNKSHVGPIVLAKGIPLNVFEDWLRNSELGLHKSERLTDGTVYIPQACAPDHGILRQLLGNPELFPILSMNNSAYLESGSGSHGGLNPDVFWFRPEENSAQSRVIFEVGISQSLPDLRRRAYALCSSTNTWDNLVYVILIKRYSVRRLYVEIWRRIAPGGDVDTDAPGFANDQRAPEDLGVEETMEFVRNAHASNPGIQRNDALAWQFDLQSSCSIPAGDDLVAGGTAVTFNAQTLLNKCRYEDQNVL